MVVALAKCASRKREVATLVPWLGSALLVVGLAAVTGIGLPLTSAIVPPAGDAGLSPPPMQTKPAAYRSAVLSNEDWNNSLRSEQAWQKRKTGNAGSGSGASTSSAKPPPVSPWGLFDGPFDPDDLPRVMSAPRAAWSNGYRTVCVRLCDGYYFPISFAAGRDRLGDDEQTCERRCPTGARLFVQRHSGQDPEDMVDLNGLPYGKLKTAFLYRTTYDASCKCNPHPWEREARLQHLQYAMEAERNKASRRKVAELRDASPDPMARARLEPAKSKDKSSPVSVIAGKPQQPAIELKPAGAGADAIKSADASIDEDPASKRAKARGVRLAGGEKALPKPMRIGASNPAGGPNGTPAARSDSGGGDWRRKALYSN